MTVIQFLKKLSLVLLFLPIITFAQQDTSFLIGSVNQAKKAYYQKIQGQAHLYNGSDYLEYSSVSDEHPYYITDDWSLGTINYGHEVYETVPILYDISADKVITEHYYNSNKMQLVSEMISSFTIQNRIFIRIIKNDPSIPSVSTGFYEVLKDGLTKVYARRTKAFQKRISSDQYSIYFEEKNRYYIYKNKGYYEVASKSSTLQVLGDKKDEVKKFIKSNHIKFKTNPENSIVAIVTYYDSLN